MVYAVLLLVVNPKTHLTALACWYALVEKKRYAQGQIQEKKFRRVFFNKMYKNENIQRVYIDLGVGFRNAAF